MSDNITNNVPEAPPVSSAPPVYGVGSLSGGSYNELAALMTILMQCIENNLEFSQGSINTEFASMTAARESSFRGANWNLIKDCILGTGSIIAGSLSVINSLHSNDNNAELENKYQDAQNQLKNLRDNYDPMKIPASGTGTGEAVANGLDATVKGELNDGAFRLENDPVTKESTLTTADKAKINEVVGHMKANVATDPTEFNAYKEQFKKKETDLLTEANTYQQRMTRESQELNLVYDFGKQATQGIAQSVGAGAGYVANKADTVARSYASQEQVASKQGSVTDQNTQSLASQIQALQQALNAMYSAA